MDAVDTALLREVAEFRKELGELRRQMAELDRRFDRIDDALDGIERLASVSSRRRPV